MDARVVIGKRILQSGFTKKDHDCYLIKYFVLGRVKYNKNGSSELTNV